MRHHILDASDLVLVRHYELMPRWFYKDASGVEQGPFEDEAMREWCVAGYFRLDLEVRRERDAERKTIEELRPGFAVSILPEEKEEDAWYYCDTERITRGPFPRVVLLAWLMRGYFKLDTLVRPSTQSSFQPLEQYKELTLPAQRDDVEDASLYYYFDIAGTEQGPHPVETLMDWLKKGTATKSILVRQCGQSEYNTLGDVLDSISAGMGYVEWVYRDDEGEEQGPFTSEEMYSWVEAGYLAEDLQVRQASSATYVALGSVKKDIMLYGAQETRELTKWMYQDLDGKEHGPFTLQDMVELGQTGVLSCDFQYRNQTEPTWSSVPDAAFIESISDSWFYLDTSLQEQGPFSTEKMRAWFAVGHFTDTLEIRASNETSFRKIKQRARPSFCSGIDRIEKQPTMWFYLSASKEDCGPFGDTQMEQMMKTQTITMQTPVRTMKEVEYQVVAIRDDCEFLRHVKVESTPFVREQHHIEPEVAGPSRIISKRLDRAGRQMYQYFDADAWQEEKATEQEQPQKRTKRRKAK